MLIFYCNICFIKLFSICIENFTDVCYDGVVLTNTRLIRKLFTGLAGFCLAHYYCSTGFLL